MGSRYMVRLRLLLGVPLALLDGPAALAQAYGQGAYGETTYGHGLVQIGSLILPLTGSQALETLAALAVAVGASVALIAFRRRKRSGRAER